MNERFISPCKPPEGLERELLTILAEECAEVAQRCTKALRFGLEEVQPGQEYTNAERIEVELGDILAAFNILEEMGVMNWDNVTLHAENKRFKLQRYLQSTQTTNSSPKGDSL
ncbi:MAG: hypothetical protein JKY34_07475 [Kordiimonadaceae bacterium]|nr:hypothetical protein [Kordiimonadaceae bacterium]